MRRIFGQKKETVPPPTLEEASDKLTARGDSLDEKIRKLDEQLMKHKDLIKKAKSGPAQEAAKRRALQVLKQKKVYEQQRDQIFNQQANIDNATFMMQTAKDNVNMVQSMQATNQEMKKLMKNQKELRIENIDKLADDAYDMQYWNEEVNDALGQMYNVPVDVDEEELMGELDALELDEELMAGEQGVPSYLQEPEMPAAPTGQVETATEEPQDEFGLPAIPLSR